VIAWERPPGLHVILIDETSQSPAGRGACGGCPVTEYVIVTLDPAGRVREIAEGTASQRSGMEVSIVPPALAGARLDETEEELFARWGDDAAGWLRAHPEVGRQTLPPGFDLAFIYGAPWLKIGPIEVVTLRYDAATGRYATSTVAYGDPE
jgi:hypothetical protein